MPNTNFKPKAYVKEGCPYSRQYLAFMTDAGLMDEIEVIRVSPMDPAYDETKSMLSERLGKRATFPTVEVEPGRYQSESNDLIRYFSEKYGADTADTQDR